MNYRLRTRPSRPSVPDLKNALLEVWSKIPMNTLMDSLPRRVNTVMATKGGLHINGGMSLKHVCVKANVPILLTI